MAGVELRLPDGAPATEAAFARHQNMLHRGFIFLPEGEHGNVISFTPPLTITKAQLAESRRRTGKSFKPRMNTNAQMNENRLASHADAREFESGINSRYGAIASNFCPIICVHLCPSVVNFSR